jgi:hypothetical protein
MVLLGRAAANGVRLPHSARVVRRWVIYRGTIVAPTHRRRAHWVFPLLPTRRHHRHPISTCPRETGGASQTPTPTPVAGDGFQPPSPHRADRAVGASRRRSVNRGGRPFDARTREGSQRVSAASSVWPRSEVPIRTSGYGKATGDLCSAATSLPEDLLLAAPPERRRVAVHAARLCLALLAAIQCSASSRRRLARRPKCRNRAAIADVHETDCEAMAQAGAWRAPCQVIAEAPPSA